MNTLHLDIETGDPDDLWTLALMSTHPRVNLQAVTVFPGGRDQIGLVKKVLSLCDRNDVFVGANVKEDGKSRVSSFYTGWLGKIDPSDPDGTVLEAFKKTKGGDLLTGGPLSNIKTIADANPAVIDQISIIFDNWTCQGGFVGNNIVSNNLVLEKFRGMDTVATFNLNGDPKAAEYLLDHTHNPFRLIKMVGKNVCHGFIFDQSDVDQLPKGEHAGLDLMIDGMNYYCKKKSQGKAMHDILAALCHIAPQHGQWITGVPFRRKGKWGFQKAPSNINALVGVDRECILKWLT
jgi:inosine-uridine nucleoside N-ribohydrolase